MVWAMCVFDVVVRSLAEVWVAPLVVVGVDGADYLSVRGCSRVWVGVLAVVSVVWVACWWTTCAVLVWAFRVFEVVG